jgi:hypothetical protein
MKKLILGMAQGLMLTALLLGKAECMDEYTLITTYLTSESAGRQKLLKLVQDVRWDKSRDKEFGLLIDVMREMWGRGGWERIATEDLIEGARNLSEEAWFKCMQWISTGYGELALLELLQAAYTLINRKEEAIEENERLRMLLVEGKEALRAKKAGILELENQLLPKKDN